MKTTSILIMALAAGTLAAQDEPRLDARFQLFAELAWPAQIVVAQPNASTNINDQPGRQTGIGFRFLGEIAPAPGFYYELGGMFDASSHFTYSGTLPGGATLDMTDAKLTNSYFSLGAAWMPKFGDNVTLGLHLEARGEYLRVQGGVNSSSLGGTVQQDQSVTYLVPWARGSFDYTFGDPGKNLRPFLGVEGGWAILRTSQTRVPDFTNGNLDNRTVESLAPHYSGAVYAGLRF